MGTKGGGWEWGVARKLSRWLANGEDQHLIRANASGGWATSRTKAGKDVGFSHVGDVAPAGPEVPETVALFCAKFLVECKAYKAQPKWWSVFSSGNPVVFRWWHKAVSQAAQDGRLPLLVAKRNNQPVVVGHRLNVTVDGPLMMAQVGGVSVLFHRLDDVLATDPITFLESTSLDVLNL